MEQLIRRVLSKLFPDNDVAVIRSEDGKTLELPSIDQIQIVYPVLERDYHFEDMDGARIKHSNELFALESSGSYMKNDLILARTSGVQIYLLFSCTEDGEALLEALEESLAQRFKASFSGAIETRIRDFKDRIEENEDEATRLGHQLLNLHKQIHTDTQAFNALDGTKGEWIRKTHSEFANLKHLIPNYYESFRIDGDELIAKTHEVSINYDGNSYDIGVFEVKITLSTGDLDIQNLTHEVNGYQHPHISGGKPCLGNIGNGVIRMLAEMELFGALQMIHSFLHSYNDGSPYQKIEFWDPDHEGNEETRYSDCHEDNHGHECVRCGGEDDRCPYYEFAHEDCLGNSSLTDCVRCDYQCHLGRHRIEQEKQKRQPAEVLAA